jgi:hypothetical protein
MLWGHSIDFWDWLGIRTMIAGAAFGFLALATSLFSSYVLYRVDGAQKIQLKTQSDASSESVATLEKQAETLKGENLKLQIAIDRMALPRRLTLEQINLLVKALGPLKETLKGKVEITSADETDARRYAGDFMNIFTALYIIPNEGAPPNPPLPRSRVFAAYINADVALETSDPEGEKLVWALSQALKSAGLIVARIVWEHVHRGHTPPAAPESLV